jgi:hypothetical protein
MAEKKTPHPKTKPLPLVEPAPIEQAPEQAPEPVVVVVEPPKKKRRRWPWILGGVLVLLAILLTIAFFIADGYAKDYARDYIKQRIVAVLGITDPDQVKVDIGDGSVLLQALAGRLDTVDVDAGIVSFGVLTGAATVHAEGVPLAADAATRELTVRFAVAEKDVGALAGNLSGLTLDSVSLEEPEIVATTTFSFFGFQIPVGMGIEPSAADGQIVFTPTSIRLGDETYTAKELKDSFGGFADQLLAQQSFCVNENLPAALTIVDVGVQQKDLVVQINGDGVALGGADLSTPGTCAAG